MKAREKIKNPALQSALESAGFRYTQQRAAIFEYLQSVECHPTAEQVYDAVRKDIDNISLATVYKSLEALVKCNLASKIAAEDGPARYDFRCDNHYHLRCLETGQVWDLDVEYDPDLIRKMAPDLIQKLQQEGIEVTGYRLELLGQPANPELNSDSHSH